MRSALIYASIISLALPAAGWSIPGSAFGRMPGEALTLQHHDCKDATAINQCRLPSRAQIGEEIKDFLDWSEGRIETIQTVAGELASVAEEVVALAGDDPDSAYRTFYLQCASSISDAAQDQAVVDDLMLVGRDSPMLHYLRELGDLVARYDGRIASAPDAITAEALTMAKNTALKNSLQALPALVGKMGSVEHRYFRDAGRNMLYKVTFNASSLVNVDERCNVHEYLVFKSIVISREAPSGNEGSLALIEDAAVLKAAFDGTASHKGALSFYCPRLFLFSPRVRYDAKTHTVVNEWKQGGNHIGGYVSVPGAYLDELLELLRKTFSP